MIFHRRPPGAFSPDSFKSKGLVSQSWVAFFPLNLHRLTIEYYRVLKIRAPDSDVNEFLLLGRYSQQSPLLITMPTSKLDRLNKLFEGEKRFAQADPDKPHIIDLDVIAKSSEVDQAVSRTVPAKKPGKIPEVTQTSSKITPSSPPSRQDTALPTSSNADEYVGSFSGKSTLIKPSISSLPAGQSSKGEYHRKVMVGAHLNRSASGLVDHDVDGNPLTGHFCPLTLVAKLPYKYMTDTDGRVSKHFFAENKFYLREWDV